MVDGNKEANPFENLNQVDEVPSELKQEVMSTIENKLTDEEGNIVSDIDKKATNSLRKPLDSKFSR
ncbi:MAG: hypothetical protein NXI00_24255 [Cytophagales bacterium]|nr:hypothetical protein [Cytophagales bacterium]